MILMQLDRVDTKGTHDDVRCTSVGRTCAVLSPSIFLALPDCLHEPSSLCIPGPHHRLRGCQRAIRAFDRLQGVLVLATHGSWNLKMLARIYNLT